MGKVLNIVMFPQELIDLDLELAHHPLLIELINQHPANEWEMRLAHIASYCEVILDGVYGHEQILQLSKILTQKLQDKRKKLILITSPTGMQ